MTGAIDTFFSPLLIKALRVLIGKNTASLARWAQTALGTVLVSLGLMDPASAQDGFTVMELFGAMAGFGLILEARANNWLRGRQLYGLNVSPLASVIGRGGLTLARAGLNIVSTWLVTAGVFDMTPDVVASLPVDTVIAGLIGMASTRLISWTEAWLKGELPEQDEMRQIERSYSVDGI